MAKQPAKYCHISRYIEKKSPDFYTLLTDYCLLAQLKPRKDLNGVTFVWPAPDTIKKLSELLVTDDIGKGVEILMSHIIQDFLPTADDWQRSKDDVPNAHRKKVPVQVKNGKVTIENGVTIVPDPAFKQLTMGDRSVNQCVWLVEGKKEITYRKDAEPSKYTFAKKGAKPLVKGGHFSKRPTSSKQYMSQQLAKFSYYAFDAEEKMDNALFEILVSLMTCLEKHHPEVYNRLIPHMSVAPISSFIFAMLHLPDEAFDKWYRDGRYPVDRSVSAWHTLLNDAAKKLPADPAREIKLPADMNKGNFHEKFKTYYKALIAARGGAAAATDELASELFGYNLSAYYEVAILIPAIQEIAALRGKTGLTRMGAARDLQADIRRMQEMIQDQKSIYLSPAGRMCDPDSVTCLQTVFRYSDLCGYRLHLVAPAADLKLQLRPGDGDDETLVLPFVAKFNLVSYEDSDRDPEGIVPQLSGLSEDKFKALMEKVDAMRKSVKPVAAPAAAAPAVALVPAPVEVAVQAAEAPVGQAAPAEQVAAK